MATGNKEKLDKISTGDILQKLKEADGNNTEFFYLYISTAGKEHKRQKNQLLPGQKTINFPTQSSEDEESDDTDTGEDNDEQMEEDTTATTSQPVTLPDEDIQVAQNDKKARNDAMNKVHKIVVPNVLRTGGWRKVHDKDLRLTYRALYFNIIEKHQGEDDNAYIQRVGEIRKILATETHKVKEEYHVNFRMNSLLSKPFLYDEVALVEQSIREQSTQKQPRQTRLDAYIH